MMQGLTITLAQQGDAEAIWRLQRLAYQSEAELYQDWSIPPLTESLDALRAEFDRQSFFKALDAESKQIVGSVRASLHDSVCAIGRLIVQPELQGRGIGTALLQYLEQHFTQASRFELFTGNRSERNLSLYQRLGYVAFEEKKLSDQVTLVFLRKNVQQS